MFISFEFSFGLGNFSYSISWFQPGWLTFVVARRGMARTWILFYTTPHHAQGWGGRGLLQLCWAWMGGRDSVEFHMVSEPLCGNRSPLLYALLLILLPLLLVFLFHLLCPVNFSYLNLWSLSSVPPVLLSVPMQGEGVVEGEVSKWYMVWNTERGNTIPKLWQNIKNFPIGRDLGMSSSPASCFGHIRQSVWSIYSRIWITFDNFRHPLIVEV